MKTISKIILFYLRREREREREREKRKRKKREREKDKEVGLWEKKKDIEVCEREFVLVNGLTIFNLFISLSNVT